MCVRAVTDFSTLDSLGFLSDGDLEERDEAYYGRKAAARRSGATNPTSLAGESLCLAFLFFCRCCVVLFNFH